MVATHAVRVWAAVYAASLSARLAHTFQVSGHQETTQALDEATREAAFVDASHAVKDFALWEEDQHGKG